MMDPVSLYTLSKVAIYLEFFFLSWHMLMGSIKEINICFVVVVDKKNPNLDQTKTVFFLDGPV